MAVTQRSQFLYIPSIEETINQYLNFNVGAGEQSITIPIGSYTISDLVNKISILLSDEAGQTFTCSLNRTTLKVNISSTSNFSLLPVSGSQASSSVFGILGFTTDRSGASSYNGDLSVQTLYRPQFWLQNFVSPLHHKRSVQESINESANGLIEVVKFGIKRLTKFSIDFITNISQTNNIIENDSNAVEKAINFLDFITEKKYFEFMPDRTTPEVFYKLLLEKTDLSQTGTGYELREFYDKGLANYFSTGEMEFRVVD